jgi:hypothetical protein
MGAFDELLSGIYSTTITHVAVMVREVRLRVGVLSRPVTIRIYFDPKRDESYFCEISEFVRPAGEPDARAHCRSGPTEAEALRRAIRMLTEDYEKAVRSGELPEDSWLVPGDNR